MKIVLLQTLLVAAAVANIEDGILTFAFHVSVTVISPCFRMEKQRSRGRKLDELERERNFIEVIICNWKLN